MTTAVSDDVYRTRGRASAPPPRPDAAGAVGLLAARALFVASGEAALFCSRGGLDLLGPSRKASYDGPNGASAHVLGGGLGCGLELFVADRPWSQTMRCVQAPSGHCHCGDAFTSRVRWEAKGRAIMVDESGAALVDEPSHLFDGLRWAAARRRPRSSARARKRPSRSKRGSQLRQMLLRHPDMPGKSNGRAGGQC